MRQPANGFWLWFRLDAALDLSNSRAHDSRLRCNLSGQVGSVALSLNCVQYQLICPSWPESVPG